jgi:hypothetical protein
MKKRFAKKHLTAIFIFADGCSRRGLAERGRLGFLGQRLGSRGNLEPENPLWRHGLAVSVEGHLEVASCWWSVSQR